MIYNNIHISPQSEACKSIGHLLYPIAPERLQYTLFRLIYDVSEYFINTATGELGENVPVEEYPEGPLEKTPKTQREHWAIIRRRLFW